MGLAARIIPTVLNKKGSLVKGKGFASDRIVGHAYQASRIYGVRNVDELVLLDVAATKYNMAPDYEMVKRLADRMFIPLTVGGGVKSIFHIKQLLRSGADKVAICTEALERQEFIVEASERFGKQCITVSIDVRENGAVTRRNGEICHNITAEAWAMCCQMLGAGEILLQNVVRDGTLQGYDLKLIEAVSESVDIPVIVSGGCSGYEDMYNALQAGASAVAASALFLFTDATPKGAAEYLANKGVEVRL